MQCLHSSVSSYFSSSILIDVRFYPLIAQRSSHCASHSSYGMVTTASHLPCKKYVLPRRKPTLEQLADLFTHSLPPLPLSTVALLHCIYPGICKPQNLTMPTTLPIILACESSQKSRRPVTSPQSLLQGEQMGVELHRSSYTRLLMPVDSPWYTCGSPPAFPLSHNSVA